jgi:hypothetical protein
VAGVTLPELIRHGAALPEQEAGRLRNVAASMIFFPARLLARAVSKARGTAALQFAMITGAIAILVGGLLIGLPVKTVAGQTMPTMALLAPQADGHRAESNLPLDVPFQVQFTKPMNEGTVASALTLSPPIAVRLLWDATGQILSIAPEPYWAPYTQYTVDVSTAASDQEGLSLAKQVHSSFQSGSPTAGGITATKVVGDRIAPTTAFQITFTRPVKLATVMLRFAISPPVDFSVVGDDPTDAASQVFTITPKKTLTTDTDYTVSLADGGTDAAGATLQAVNPFEIKTLQTPSVVKFSPQDGVITYDTNQPISVQFSLPMDEKSAAAALSVTVSGRSVLGSTSWTDDGTTLVFTPRSSFYVGARVSVRVETSARSTGGLSMARVAGITFTVSQPKKRIYATTTRIPFGGGIGATQWSGSEYYYLSLMNCTRTGGWVTSGGDCSTATHHTLPARDALRFDEGIASGVSRPYAKALADLGALTHYLNGTTAHSRLAAGGYPGPAWGENIASPGSSGAGGMIAVELFFQDESGYRGGHYNNIMNGHFSRAGIGIWVSNGRCRVVIDFYG